MLWLVNHNAQYVTCRMILKLMKAQNLQTRFNHPRAYVAVTVPLFIVYIYNEIVLEPYRLPT